MVELFQCSSVWAEQCTGASVALIQLGVLNDQIQVPKHLGFRLQIPFISWYLGPKSQVHTGY